ncbi:riboflavin kinase [Elysia marginata]|uniref:Riboflavin kinase n=1 Tax=Elysia marginata TaxID=1093978 RepID=A0AAV4HMA2_9GAST|nr:riboflavin kinase [Elysia marginata]
MDQGRPIPYFAEGEVVSGFGRGSKELGIPTANFPESVIQDLPSSFDCGVYYGWAKLNSYPEVFKMTMCVGWNPYYQNTVKTMETHIIHQFDSDFYGDVMKIIVLGFIRPMCDFPSLDALIKAIHNDIEVASKSLDTEESLQFKDDPFFNAEQPIGIQENTASEKNTAVNTNQAMTSESHPKPCETGNRSETVEISPVCTLNTETSEANNGAVKTRKNTSAPVNVNGVSSPLIIENSNTGFFKKDFSESGPLINYSDNCKDSI